MSFQNAPTVFGENPFNVISRYAPQNMQTVIQQASKKDHYVSKIPKGLSHVKRSMFFFKIRTNTK